MNIQIEWKCVAEINNAVTTYDDNLAVGAEWWCEPVNSDYGMVDEEKPDDLGYLRSETTGDRVLMTHATYSDAGKIVKALIVQMRAMKTNVASIQIRPLINSNGSISQGTARDLGTAMGVPLPGIWETNPNGGGAWDATAINNCQIGAESVIP